MKVSSLIDWDARIPTTAPWVRRTAPMALVILLDRLKNNAGSMSYGELAAQMRLRFGERIQPNKQKYGRPLGAAAQFLIDIGREHGMDVPALTVIVVREDIGYPGKGVDWFVQRLRNSGYDLKDPRRLAILDTETKRVWRFGRERWAHLERLLGPTPLPNPQPSARKLGRPPRVKRRGKGEGAAHIALKHWVAEHPERFKEFGHYTCGTFEECLQSGDSIDAMLFGPSTRLAVEVKASNATQDELTRGIFQCVKYRKTLEAEACVYPDFKLPGTCVLVSTNSLSKKNERIAQLLAVPFRKLPMSCERTR